MTWLHSFNAEKENISSATIMAPRLKPNCHFIRWLVSKSYFPYYQASQLIMLEPPPRAKSILSLGFYLLVSRSPSHSPLHKTVGLKLKYTSTYEIQSFSQCRSPCLNSSSWSTSHLTTLPLSASSQRSSQLKKIQSDVELGFERFP